MGTDATRGPTTTSGRPTRSTSPAFWIDADAGHQRPRTCAFVEAGGYDDAALVDARRAGRWRRRGRPATPAVLGARRRRRGCARRFGRRRAAARRRAGAARLLVRGRRLRAVGRARGCPPRPSGRRRRRWDPAAGRKRRYPWGDDDPDARRAPTSASATSARARSAPTRRARRRYGVPPDARRRVGVDVERLRAPTRASRRSPTASTPRCSSAPTTRCCAAARGPPTRRRAATTFRNWDYPIRRQIFAGFRCARAADARPGRLMCRHLAYLGPPRTLADAAARRRRTRCCEQSWAPREQRHGHGERRRLRRGLVRPRRGRSRPATGAARRCGPTGRSPASPTSCQRRRARGGPLARRPASPVDETRHAAVHRPGRWLFSHNGAVAELRPRRCRACARALPADGRGRRSRAPATPRCCSPSLLDRLATAATPLAEALAAVVADVADRGRRSGSTCCSPTVTRSWPPRGGDTLFVARRRPPPGRRRSSPPSRRRRRRDWERRCPTASLVRRPAAAACPDADGMAAASTDPDRSPA